MDRPDLILSSTGSFAFGSVRAGAYTVTAFRDVNGNQNQDSFEDFGSSFSVVVATDAATSGVDVVIAGASAPSVPQGFAGVALSTWQVKWNWSDVTGETGYLLRNASSGTVASLGQNDTAYIETGFTFANSSGAVRGVVAFNSNGNSGASISSTVYTLANVPGIPAFGAVGASTIAVSWPANGNAAGPVIGSWITGVNLFVDGGVMVRPAF